MQQFDPNSILDNRAIACPVSDSSNSHCPGTGQCNELSYLGPEFVFVLNSDWSVGPQVMVK